MTSFVSFLRRRKNGRKGSSNTYSGLYSFELDGLTDLISSIYCCRPNHTVRSSMQQRRLYSPAYGFFSEAIKPLLTVGGK